MDRRWLIPLVLGLSLLTWYLVEAVPKFGQPSPEEAQAEQDNPNMRIERGIRYVERPDVDPALTSLNIYAPLFEGPHPVVVFVQSARWRRMGDWRGERRMGDGPSEQDRYRDEAVEEKAPWLTSRGYVLVGLNYRSAPDVVHPEPVRDVAAALKWLRDNVSTYGGDPKRIIVMGHSTGAQLAALAALDGRYLKEVGAPPDTVAGLVLLDGAGYDVPRYLEEASPRWRRWLEGAFGADPATQRDASPIHYVATASHLPLTLLVYRSDRPSSSGQGELMAEALRAAGGQVEVLPVENKGHFSLHRELGVVNDALTLTVERFLADFVLLPDVPPSPGKIVEAPRKAPAAER